MKKKPVSKSAFFNSRALISFAFCVIGVFLSLLAFSLYPGGNAFAKQDQPAAPAVVKQSAPVSQSGDVDVRATAFVEEKVDNSTAPLPSAKDPAQLDVIGATFVVNT